MSQTILITGSTDGIGLETAKKLLEQGYHVLLHGRNPKKLEKVADELSALGDIESYVADLSDMIAVRTLVKQLSDKHQTLDVLINNAGILKSPNTMTKDGLDIRFAVNTIAPYLLTKLLLPLLKNGRVVNLSSGAQAPVNLDTLVGKGDKLSAMEAYSQSKLALTMWSFALAKSRADDEPIVVAVNPGSLLASKMVKEGFGVAGNDINIGANILVRASLSEEFADANGKYFDNDSGKFTDPHQDALSNEKCNAVVNAIKNVVSSI